MVVVLLIYLFFMSLLVLPPNSSSHWNTAIYRINLTKEIYLPLLVTTTLCSPLFFLPLPIKSSVYGYMTSGWPSWDSPDSRQRGMRSQVRGGTETNGQISKTVDQSINLPGPACASLFLCTRSLCSRPSSSGLMSPQAPSHPTTTRPQTSLSLSHTGVH